jgi:hypothetical protein
MSAPLFAKPALEVLMASQPAGEKKRLSLSPSSAAVP